MNYSDLDNMILGNEVEERSASLASRAIGFVTLKKLAEEIYEEDAEHEAMESPEEEELEEDGFDDGIDSRAMVIQAMANMATLKFQKAQAYITYGQLIRSLSQDSLMNDWRGHSYTENKHAEFFVRRLGALAPSFVMPVTPPLPITKDPAEIIRNLIGMETQALSLMAQLRNMLEEGDPTRFTIEQFMTEDQYHQDQLYTRLPEMEEKVAAAKESIRAKVAAAAQDHAEVMQEARQGLQANLDARMKKGPPSGGPLLGLRQRLHAKGTKALQKDIRSFDGAENKTAALLRKFAAGDEIGLPAPGAEPIEATVARERQLAAQQALNENQMLRQQLSQASQAAVQAQQQSQQTEQALQEAQQQAEQGQAELEQAQQSAQMTQQQAVQAETRAAEHATQKMQLSMKVQQMRSALAEIATTDPVTEMGGDVSDVAAAGGPETPADAQQQEEAEAAAQQGPADPEVEKETEEAAKAQDEAEQQTAQAQQVAAEKAPGGTGAQPFAGADAPAGG